MRAIRTVNSAFGIDIFMFQNRTAPPFFLGMPFVQVNAKRPSPKIAASRTSEGCFADEISTPVLMFQSRA